MATEKQANRARALHQENLVRVGAHAISVEEAANGGFCVVSWVQPGRKTAMTNVLQVEERGKMVDVPLIIRLSAPFKPE